ncbi:IclR family transcriptional regulator [Tranquillimonas alkanivorans]|uniref:Transcriptional regulator, IclR family n=1 Tax=Tranquillimonas alkanivorans TaxID=441119 RepID=A0A1I5Q3D1_9RHOB|nr:IclR family transcriptional regulator [Tranquillimonas alkanivorans]SFP40709.1 transcriptional regulator, IclR family [Tranquillimonas alkanivorans]
MSGAGSGERILALLGLFSEARPEWTPDEMMAETGYARPTLYRYLKALKEAGLVASLSGATYTLGPRVVELDFLMRRSDPLIEAGEPLLRDLSEAWPCTALLVRWYGNRLLCVASECSAENPKSSYPRGRPMPLARGAISRAILAYLPRRQMQQKIAENLGELSALGLGDTPEAVADTFRKVRRAGAAIAHGEVTPGVVGIAAPVFDAGHSPVAALCLTLAEDVATPDRRPDIARAVWRAGERLSEQLAERGAPRAMETSA